MYLRSILVQFRADLRQQRVFVFAYVGVVFVESVVAAGLLHADSEPLALVGWLFAVAAWALIIFGICNVVQDDSPLNRHALVAALPHRRWGLWLAKIIWVTIIGILLPIGISGSALAIAGLNVGALATVLTEFGKTATFVVLVAFALAALTANGRDFLLALVAVAISLAIGAALASRIGGVQAWSSLDLQFVLITIGAVAAGSAVYITRNTRIHWLATTGILVTILVADPISAMAGRIRLRHTFSGNLPTVMITGLDRGTSRRVPRAVVEPGIVPLFVARLDTLPAIRKAPVEVDLSREPPLVLLTIPHGWSDSRIYGIITRVDTLTAKREIVLEEGGRFTQDDFSFFVVARQNGLFRVRVLHSSSRHRLSANELRVTSDGLKAEVRIARPIVWASRYFLRYWHLEAYEIEVPITGEKESVAVRWEMPAPISTFQEPILFRIE